MGILAVILPDIIKNVIGSGRNIDRKPVAILEFQAGGIGVGDGGDSTALIFEQHLPFVFQAVAEGAGNRQPGAVGGDLGLMAVHQFQPAGVGGFFIRSELSDQHLGGMAAQVFPLILGAIQGVGDAGLGRGQIEVAPVGGGLIVSGQVEEQVAEHLIGAHFIVVASGVFIPGPETAFVQAQAFAGGQAENQRPHAPVADGQGLVHVR